MSSEHFGPWITPINVGRHPRLNAFWRQRLSRLGNVSGGDCGMTRRKRAVFIVVMAAIVIFPTLRQQAISGEAGKAPAKPTPNCADKPEPCCVHAAKAEEKSPGSDFPFAIAFVRGLSEFRPGDAITITDVRGTSSDMQSGICRITGTYTLASEDKATLAASVTARDSADGIGPWNKAQTMDIARGHGKFTLLLPISVSGWPHVSFYGKTNSFGGVYVGTGDSVLRHW